MKLPNGEFILDMERCISPEIKEALDQALYWEIEAFRPDLSQVPTTKPAAG